MSSPKVVSITFFALLQLLIQSIAHATVINGHDWVLNLEYRQFTSENPPFSRRVYVCDISIEGNCEDPATWDALTPEPGWERAEARVRLFDAGDSVLLPPSPGVPGSIDFNGYAMNYTADVLSASVIDFFGPFALASVQRDTELTYNAGTVIHEAKDPLGNTYILFTATVSLAELYDLTLEDALTDLSLPNGWSYSSRTLSETLVAATGGIASVFAAPTSSWQQYSVNAVPSPATVWLFCCALFLLPWRRESSF